VDRDRATAAGDQRVDHGRPDPAFDDALQHLGDGLAPVHRAGELGGVRWSISTYSMSSQKKSSWVLEPFVLSATACLNAPGRTVFEPSWLLLCSIAGDSLDGVRQRSAIGTQSLRKARARSGCTGLGSLALGGVKIRSSSQFQAASPSRLA